MAEQQAARSLIPEGHGFREPQARILEAAVRRFFHRGYHATTVREIAREAGIKAASIYEQFPSKDAILAAVVDLVRNDLLPHIAEAIDASGDDPADQLRALVRSWVEKITVYPELAIVVTQEYRSLPRELSAGATVLDSRLRYLIANVIVRGNASGAFANRNFIVAGAAIGSMCIRTPYWYVPVAGYGPADLGRDLAEIALSIVKTPMEGFNPA